MFLGFDFKESLQNFFEKAEDSFRKSLNGKEDIKVVIRYWGIAAYIFFFFVVKWLIDGLDVQILKFLLAALSVAYFSWHIYAVYKCKPKKEKLTKEQREELKKNRAKNLSTSFARKLLLQESLSKWDPVTITIVTDLFFVITFLGYL